MLRGLQRYRCCGCGRTFNALTGTPLARLRHRERWLPGLDGMLEGKSVLTADQLLRAALDVRPLSNGDSAK